MGYFPAVTSHMHPMDISTPVAASSSPYDPDLRVGSLFAKAWAIYKDNLGLVVGATLVYLGIAAVLTGGSTWGVLPGMGGLNNLVWIVVAGPLTVGLYGMLLKLVRVQEALITDLFDGFQDFGRAFGVYALYSIAVIVGFILLVVPGLIVATGLFPALFLVYDEDRGVVETLQRAWEMTRGHKFDLFIVGVAIVLVNLLGLIALVVGVIFTAGLSYLVAAAAFEELSLAAS